MDDRTYTLSTKWTGEQAHGLAVTTANILKSFGYNIKLDETKRLGFGEANVFPNGTSAYSVGIREIAKQPRKRFSIYEALNPTVICFHEVSGHGGQWRNETQKNTPLSKVLMLNDIACKSSGLYYGADTKTGEASPPYFDQPHEIAAQYMGLKMCQEFLTSLYGAHAADALLREYVNLRIARQSEFIPLPNSFVFEPQPDGRPPFLKPTEPFASMDEVYAAFQENFIKQAFAPADYVVPKGSADYAAIYINERNRFWERAKIRGEINRIPDRLTLAYALASFWLEQRSEYSWLKEQPVFRDMAFMPDAKSFLNNAPPKPKEPDLDLSRLTKEDIDFARAVSQLTAENQTSLERR